MLPKSSIAKGKVLENHVCDELRRRLLDQTATRSAGSGSGTRDKADVVSSFQVLNRNIGIECKNHKTISIPQWWEQTEKLRPLGMLPLLVFKIRNQPLEESLVTLKLYDLLDIFEKLKEPQTVNPDRDFKWKLGNLKNAIKQLEKYL